MTTLRYENIDTLNEDQRDSNESVVVITYATHDQGYFRCLRESCERFGYPLIVLGFGRKWNGYGAKLQETLKAMREQPPNQFVIFVDAFDTFMCGPPQDAIAAFKAAGSPRMIVGASRPMTTESLHRKLFGESRSAPPRCRQSPYQFLCSGTYMCRAGDGVELFSSLLPIKESDDDQELIVRLRNRLGDDSIRLDCGCELFGTFCPKTLNGSLRQDDKISVLEKNGLKRIHCGVTNTMPVVVHGPGNTDLSPLVAAMEFEDGGAGTPNKFIVEKVYYHGMNVLSKYSSMILLAAFSALILTAVVLITVLLKRYQSEIRGKEARDGETNNILSRDTQ